jgi:phosphopantothenoylcysteine decarboxylase/phosphopantothenate--cysteine ligase
VARVLLGVTGGIAAYKALEFVRLATKAGHAVRVVQTPTSEQFVGKASFAGLTGAPVLTDEFERDPARGAFPDQQPPEHDPLSHLELVRNADAFLIAPASANTIAKLANGLADNLLTSAALAATCPVLVAPAMNNAMYENAATQANLDTLRARGITVLDPGVGALGSKHEWGVGRLAEPADLLAAVEAVVPAGSRPWDGLKVLVTAGGTREAIDSVRYVGNRSSGRMGFALAEEAAARGADVTVVAANVGLARHPRVRYVDVVSAQDLLAACEREFVAADVLLMAAAVADFRPAEPSAMKIKKSDDPDEAPALRLARTPDVLAELVQARADGRLAVPVIVGFAAETDDVERRAVEKRRQKACDLLVANDVSEPGSGFGTDTNRVLLVDDTGVESLPLLSKDDVADRILDRARRRLGLKEVRSA